MLNNKTKQTLATTANAIALSKRLVGDLIGVNLSKDKEIDINNYITTRVNNGVYAKMENHDLSGGETDVA